VLLFCGAIRPYKNIDAVIQALSRPHFSGVTLIVAGKESKWPGLAGNDPLSRTKALLHKWGVKAQTILLPKMLDTHEMSELLEASDILLLPYVKGYGSGLLLLGMTFGKHILGTTAGGADEYLRDYSRCTLLESSSPDHVAAGLARAVDLVRKSPVATTPPRELSWNQITARVIEDIANRLN